MTQKIDVRACDMTENKTRWSEVKELKTFSTGMWFLLIDCKMIISNFFKWNLLNQKMETKG